QIIPEWIFAIEELDVPKGVSGCGSQESFMSVLEVFHKTAGQKADEIERYFNEEDWENYTVKVHALKSSAAIIGAQELSDRAKKLEAAGKERDTAVILEGTASLLNDYRTLDAALSRFDAGSADAPELSDDMRKDAFETIVSLAESMDYGLLEQLLRDLKGYRLTEGDAGIVREAEERLMQLDWDGIAETVRSVI
ncbi:MAG: Hpt domain-containing protein, partial [Lachnospiraceae bacterium]|nr:Hpt domain-containing protein [Lachnospiraceae bacterium]